jgi:site-specific DNA-cytosine methylase
MIQRTGYRKTPTIWSCDKPCGTLLASAGTDGKGNKRAKFLDVVLTEDNDQSPKWCRTINGKVLQRLQGYPDNWYLGDDIRKVARLIGNGVVPIVAQAACESIKYL